MNSATCFSEDELRSYLLGELPDETSDIVAMHVEECADCETTVSMLDRESDTLVASLRHPVSTDTPDSAYQLAAKRVKSQWRELRTDSAVSADSLSHLPRLRDYELLEPLARGGMGTVYRARHTRLNRQVALKVLPGRWLKNPAVVARFEREMKAVGSLKHPTIVQATDGGEAEGVHFLVMELIDGLDARALVQFLGPLPIADACEIARQAALGMAYVHDQGIIHRDLKPSNLMITRAGDVKVLDLGLARVVGEQLAGDELTTVGQLMGTLDFMAPEQLENSHEVNERADVYSLGATLYKLLNGQSPHFSDPQEPFLSKLRRIATDSPTPLQQRRADLPEELCTLVDNLLAHDAIDRPASMGSVSESLGAFARGSDLGRRVKEASKIRTRRRDDQWALPVAGNSVLGAGVMSLEPPTRIDRPRRFLSWAVAGLLLLLVAMAAVITIDTMSGQVVIETAKPDVEVRILKAGKPYRQFTLNQKANSLRLGVGEYDIEIVSEADELEVENGRYTLKRGDVWLARIVHRKKKVAGIDPKMGMAQGPQASGLTVPSVPQHKGAARPPTYEGKTHAQWLALLRTERSANQLVEACNALRKLDTNDDTETVDALLFAARYHNSKARHSSDGKSWVRIWDSIQGVLQARDQDLVVRAMTNELVKGDEAATPFILEYLAKYADRVRPLVSDRLIDRIRQIASSDDSSAKLMALTAMQAIGPIELVTELLVTALKDEQLEIVLFAAESLIKMKSSTPDVVAALGRMLTSGDLSDRAWAAWQLGDLGSQAKSALPELVQCIEQRDSTLAKAGVHRLAETGKTVSVKDAAIRAVAEIGEASVVPVLVAEWKARAFRLARAESTAEWDSDNHYRDAHSYSDDWVADAIEQLIGRRPRAVESRGRGSTIIWLINNRSLEQVYLHVFDEPYGGSTEEAVELAKTLLPLANPFERDRALKSIRKAGRGPDPKQLDVEIELIELLTESEDPKDILRSIFARRSQYLEIEDEKWKPGEKLAAITAYRTLAIRIIRAQENWQTEYSAFLLELVDGNYPGAAVALLDLIDEFDADRQAEGVVKVFQLIDGLGPKCLGTASSILKAWLNDASNRAAIQKHIEEDSSRDWSELVIGIYRSGLADDGVTGELKKRFADDSIKRGEVLQRMILSLDDQPKLANLIIELIEHPSLDETKVFNLSIGKVESSYRASEILNLLGVVPEQHRARFAPMLKRFVETGKHGESAIAKQLLDDWK